jgi:hypothetical protein
VGFAAVATAVGVAAGAQAERITAIKSIIPMKLNIVLRTISFSSFILKGLKQLNTLSK